MVRYYTILNTAEATRASKISYNIRTVLNGGLAQGGGRPTTKPVIRFPKFRNPF